MPEETSVPAGTEVVTEEATKVTQKETVNRSPVPDAEKHAHPDDAYDFEFGYLKSGDAGGNGEAAPKDGEKEQETTTPATTSESSEEQPTSPKPPDEKKVDWETRYKELQSTSDTRFSEITKERDTLKAENDQLKSVKTAVGELEKEPLKFLYSHFPDLAEKLDPEKQLNAQLKKEFGDDFVYDPSDAYQDGTPSQKFRAREMELRRQMDEARIESRVKRQSEQQKREALLIESKQRVMKDYGLTEEQFQKDIVEWSKNQPPALWDVVAKVRFQDQIIQKAVKEALEIKRTKEPAPPQSVATVGGGEQPQPSQAFKEFNDVFGDE